MRRLPAPKMPPGDVPRNGLSLRSDTEDPRFPGSLGGAPNLQTMTMTARLEMATRLFLKFYLQVQSRQQPDAITLHGAEP